MAKRLKHSTADEPNTTLIDPPNCANTALGNK